MSSTSLRSLEKTAEFFGKELTATNIKAWTAIVAGYGDAAIVWAFDNWDRNGKFFPKPSDILELIHIFAVSPDNKTQFCGNCVSGWKLVNQKASPADQKFVRCECILAAIQAGKIPDHKCDTACQRRHGRGYHTNDLLWLYKRYSAELKVNPKARVDGFMEELDAKRQGGAPEWRRVGGTAARPMEHDPISDEDIPF